jgi:hypothetical protein
MCWHYCSARLYFSPPYTCATALVRTCMHAGVCRQLPTAAHFRRWPHALLYVLCSCIMAVERAQ